MIRLAILVGIAVAVSASGRTWNSSNGKLSVVGEYVEVGHGIVMVRDTRQKLHKLPLSKLSELDVKYLLGQSRVKKNTARALSKHFVASLKGNPVRRNGDPISIKAKLIGKSYDSYCAVRTRESHDFYVISPKYISRDKGSIVIFDSVMKLPHKFRTSPDETKKLAVYLPVKELAPENLLAMLPRYRIELLENMCDRKLSPKKIAPAVAEKAIKELLPKRPEPQPLIAARPVLERLPVRMPTLHVPESDYVPPPLGAHFLDSEAERAAYQARLRDN